LLPQQNTQAMLRFLPSLCLMCIGLACSNSAPANKETESISATDISSTSVHNEATSTAAGDMERFDVLHYYRQLKPPYAPPGYPLKEVNGKWMSLSPDTEEPIEATVDIKNGFIEIVDPGTGGGDWTFRVVLFRMANGAPVLGITHTFFDGAGLLHAHYFLRPEDPRQLDWTKYTIKSLSGFDFLPLDNAEEEHIVNKLLPVSLELPRYGTSAKATVYTGLENIYCRGDDNEYSDYCILFRQVQRKEIIFKWNKDLGKFE